jgi:branched-chain amino acid transport system ATP-binding protein
MVAIARAVLAGPDVLVLDEPTEGLAPVMVTAVTRLIDRLRADGVAVLLMEQSGGFPFEVADHVLTIDRGVIRPADRSVMQDRAGQARDDRESGT